MMCLDPTMFGRQCHLKDRKNVKLIIRGLVLDDGRYPKLLLEDRETKTLKSVFFSGVVLE